MGYPWVTHGETGSRLYYVWSDMRRRCNCPQHKSYRYYGEKGVKVYKLWENSYEAFRDWAVKNGYDPNKSAMEQQLDRINPSGNYSPANCRFVCQRTNSLNRRKFKNSSSKYIGVSVCRGRWQATLYSRPENRKPFLGLFDTETEALEYRNKIIREEFGPQSSRIQEP